MKLIEYFFVIAIGLILIFFIIKYYKWSQSSVNDFILNHYEDDNWKVQDITSLSINEKIRNGVPVLDHFSYTSGWLNFPNSKTLYNRKVELKDKDNNESTKYIEVEMQDGIVVSFNEFDSYDI